MKTLDQMQICKCNNLHACSNTPLSIIRIEEKVAAWCVQAVGFFWFSSDWDFYQQRAKDDSSDWVIGNRFLFEKSRTQLLNVDDVDL